MSFRDDLPYMYQSVIFDVDGVLLRHPTNDTDVYADMVAETFRSFNISPSDSDVEAFFGASKTIGKMKQVCECHNIDLETFWAEREQRSSKLQQQMMEDGERDLYEDCTVLSTLAQTHDLGLVSTNQQETIEFMIDHFDLDGCFEAVYGREPTIEGFQRVKPTPTTSNKRWRTSVPGQRSMLVTVQAMWSQPTAQGLIQYSYGEIIEPTTN